MATRHARAPTHAAAAAPAVTPRSSESAAIERAEAARLRQAREEIEAASRKASDQDSVPPPRRGAGRGAAPSGASVARIPNPGPGPVTPPKPVATSLAPVNAAPDLTGGVSPRTASSSSPSSSRPAPPIAASPALATGASPPRPAAAAPAPVGAAATAAPVASKPTKMAAAAIPPAKVPPSAAAPAKPAALEQGVAANGPHIDFAAGTADLTAAARAELDGLAKTLAGDQNKRVQLVAYATGTADEANQARRLSLSRALNVRAYLIDHGVRNTRMDVRALGNRDDGGAPADRVDIVLLDK